MAKKYVYVKRKPGYWIYSKKPFPGYSCSECHEKYDEREYASVWKFKFCPQCGSKLLTIKEVEQDDQ